MTQRTPRLHDEKYLRWLRRRPCEACGKPAPCDAAHIKSANLALEKPFSGAMKPDDKWALSLCRSCHIRQHAHGDEQGWFAAQSVEPFKTCTRLYREFGGDGGAPKRKRRTIKPRLPREKRTKIKGRSTWGQRKLRSRK